MSFIGKNIKKIRSVKKLSQQAFADDFGLTRANIGSYEEGRAEPKITMVVEIANKFGISVEALLNQELKVNDIIKFKPADKFDSDPKIKRPDEQGSEIPFVKANNYQSYVENAESDEFISVLPQIHIPGYKFKASRAFEIGNNELLSRGEGVFETDVLICIRKDANIISNLSEGRI